MKYKEKQLIDTFLLSIYRLHDIHTFNDILIEIILFLLGDWYCGGKLRELTNVVF